METVNALIKEIHGTITQTTSSRKDEVRVMQAMLSDDSYSVDVYEKDGKVGTYCPANSAREMAASVVSGIAKISPEEAKTLAASYEFKKGEAECMVDISKEFVNTYLHTGRKLNLGGREQSDLALSLKEVPEGQRPFPKPIGVDENGKKIFGRGVVIVPAYESMKVYSPCPEWIKKNAVEAK